MEQSKIETTAISNVKPRKAFIAFLLSLIPGLGQVYNGQLKKALLFFIPLLLLPLIFSIVRCTTFYALATLFILEISVRIYALVDAVINANRQREYILKPYNTWYYHLLIGIGMIATLVIYDTRSILGIQSFKIPTTSNNPTFQVGDWLVADMKAYRNNKPNYGDIVVFSRPDGQIYTFRVVGRPNDKLQIIDNIVSVNGKPSRTKFIKEGDSQGMPVSEIEEELPNGHKHLIYKFKQPYDSTKTNIENIVVPPDSYYLLGDNRDNAADSRYEGFINQDRIKGRILYSYWGRTTDRINISFLDK